jgi:hypothetical protein
VPEDARESFVRSFEFLVEHADATWFDLVEEGLIAEGALLAPEQILAFPVDASRTDLVAEFRRAPLGPHSAELRQLLWLLRCQTPGGRYVLVRSGDASYRVARLDAGRRPGWRLVDDAEYTSLEEAEWAVFALRWRDHTGERLPERPA